MNSPDFFLIKKILDGGGVIAYPTETVYGLGCDPFQKAAVEKIFELKGRGHAPLILIRDKTWLPHFVKDIPSEAMELMRKFWPGPLTLALKANESVPLWLRHTQGTIALRISSHRWVEEFLSFYDRPLLSTSANKSGQNPLQDIESIKRIFSNEIDYYVEEIPRLRPGMTLASPRNDSFSLLPSTLVSFYDNKLHFVREGAIPFKSIVPE